LKTKYFPDSDFLNATIPRGASSTWRAIVVGRDALSSGLIKRIGDGTSIYIWTNKWIPRLRVMSPSVQIGEDEDELIKVPQLIDSDNGTSKVELVRKNFITPKAEAILNIPLQGSGGGEDFWAWGLERTCVYTVKSAYRSLMTRNELSTLAEGTVTETSTSENNCGTDCGNSRWFLRCVCSGGGCYVGFYRWKAHSNTGTLHR
jgi:hypothetical protein